MAVKMNRIRFSLRSFLAFFLLISTYIAFQVSITSDEPIVKDILRHSKPSGPSIAIVDETSPSMLEKLFFYRKRYREIVIVGGEIEPWLCEKIGKLKHIESVFIDSCRLHSACLPKSVKTLEMVNADGPWLEATINSLARLETVRCSSRINHTLNVRYPSALWSARSIFFDGFELPNQIIIELSQSESLKYLQLKNVDMSGKNFSILLQNQNLQGLSVHSISLDEVESEFFSKPFRNMNHLELCIDDLKNKLDEHKLSRIEGIENTSIGLLEIVTKSNCSCRSLARRGSGYNWDLE